MDAVQILITAKDLAAPAFARSAAEAKRLQTEVARHSQAASAATARRQQLEIRREQLYAAERASIARRAAGQTTAAQRAGEREQIASARRANTQMLTAQRRLEREEIASARRASTQIAAAHRGQAAAAAESARKIRGALVGVAAATVYAGVKAIKMASDFDASMTTLTTQAGVAKSEMGTLRSGVLRLAGSVGQDPNSLAESLFHVESNFESMGISSAKALKLTETAAKGATVGHADLVDVTNALTAAVASNIPGVQNMNKAMGVLNATVGVGDMKMQDLADAFGSGMVATVKGFGLSIQDVGAALAVFGDNNIRGSLAGNQLRMSVMALAKPVSTAHDALKKLGLTQTTLRDDMQKGGLKLALTDLVDHMNKAGISAKEQGGIITEAFGRKAGAGLNILVGQFDRLQSKYPALAEGANKFGQSWADTQKTFSFQMKALQGQFDSLMIKIGLKVIPVVQKFLGFLGDLGKSVGPEASDVLKSMGEEGGAALDALGAGIKIAAPFLTELAHGFQAILEFVTPFLAEIGRVGSAIADALFPASDASKGLSGPFTKALELVRQNKGAIQEAARGFGNALITMSEAAIANLPLITTMFATLGQTALVALGGLIDGAAAAFGWVPGIGPKLKEAARSFDGFRDSAIAGLGKAESAATSFAKKALPNLETARLKLNISDWEAQIKTAKDQLSDKNIPPERKVYLKAHIEDLEIQVRDAKQKLAAIEHHTVWAPVEAKTAPFFSALARVNGARVRNKSAFIAARTDGFWGAVRSISGKVLGTSYINVQMRRVEAQNAPRFHARGGPIHLAGGGDPGGPVSGPGTSTSDSIPAMLSNGEYVVQASSVRKYGEGFFDALNSGTLRVAGFAKGGKLTKRQQAAKAQAEAEAQARKDAAGDLSISYFGKKAGYKNDEFMHALGMADSLGSLVDSLNKWRSIIKATTHGVQESNLLKALNRAGGSLMGYEKRLASVNSALEKAKDKLSSLKDAAAQLKDSIKGGIISGANITRAAGAEESRVTINTLLSQARGDTAQAQGFQQELAALKKKGLSANLLQQIAEAGISGGGMETAQALLGASPAQLKELNDLNKALVSAADKTGAITSDAMYGAGIRAAEGLVNGLTAQQKNIEAAMMKIAKSMEKAIKHALGINSPSTVMARVGGLSMDGVELGWRKRFAHYRAMTGRQPSWASMLNQPRHAGSVPAAMPGNAGGDRPLVLNVHFGGREIGKISLDLLRKEVSTLGGVTAAFGS